MYSEKEQSMEKVTKVYHAARLFRALILGNTICLEIFYQNI